MAINNLQSVEIASKRGSHLVRLNNSLEDNGYLKSAYGQIGAVAGQSYSTDAPALAATASDAGSTMDLLTLPAGNIRLSLHLSHLRTSLVGDIKIGLRQYTDQGEVVAEHTISDVTTVAGKYLSLAEVLTVSEVDLHSDKGIVLFATSSVAITATDYLELRAVYVA